MSSQTRSFCQENPDNLASLHDDPIAIVGVGMRLPGRVHSTDSFWETLMNKKDGHGDIPASRFKATSLLDPSKAPTTGYFLEEDPAYFDAPFFSISSAEASRLDPQQRLLMEVTWECLESAGETQWRGKPIGCFVGTFGEDWLELSSKDSQAIDWSRVLSTGAFALSNRVSYEFDFRGPSMTIQTGCSASLVGLHQACQSLRTNQCSSAIVAGANLILSPTTIRSLTEGMVFSPSGKCRTFDAQADGYGRAEAINAIYIKRLSEAIRDKNPIRAIIRGTAANFDGRTKHITNPCSITQEGLIRSAYRQAGIEDIHRTAFFECHGTGTVAGDSAETAAVAKVFAPKGTIIGAVKPNFGHSEGASGLTSVIKAVLMLEHRLIPPNTHFEQPSAAIPFLEANLQVPLVPTQWPEDRDDRVSVNAFGIGGSNAHVILDSAASFPGARSKGSEDKTVQDFQAKPSSLPQLLVATAHCGDSLRMRIQDICDYTTKTPSVLKDLSYTLLARREHLVHRAFAVAQPSTPLQASDFLTLQSNRSSPSVTFVFTGQGAQWAGMGKALLETESCFQQSIKEMEEALKDLADPPQWSLKEELGKAAHESRIHDPEFSQTLCTALQVGLVAMLAAWNIQPESVIGHSSGEIAAAYAAGAISAQSAIAIAYYRGKFARSQEGRGAMMVVGLGRQAVTPYLIDGVVLACENSPENVTLSGDKEALDKVLDTIKAEKPDALCRMLPLKIAYHSSHMDTVGPSYEDAIAPYIRHDSHHMLPMISSVTCESVSEPGKLGASYWRRNLESPVLFSQAVQYPLRDGTSKSSNRVFIEIGPHSTLAAPLRQIFQHGAIESPIYIPTVLRNERDSRAQLLSTVGHAFAAGVAVNPSATAGGERPPLNDLPPYPWNHNTRYWSESRLSKDWRLRSLPPHELLGSRVSESTDTDPSWRNLLHTEKVPWLEQHVLQGEVTFPGAAYIAMAGAAVQQIHPDAGDAGYSIRNIHFKAPLLMEAYTATELITTFHPMEIADGTPSGWYSFTISAHSGSSWINHCQGQVRAGRDEHRLITAKQTGSLPRPVSWEKWYKTVRQRGLEYGPRFCGLRDITTNPVGLASATGMATDISEVCDSGYVQHPVLIDQCLQLMGIAASRGILHRLTNLYIPMMIESLYVDNGAPEIFLDTQAMEGMRGGISGNAIGTIDGKPVLAIDKAVLQALDGASSMSEATASRLASRLEWKADIDLVCPSSLIKNSPFDPDHDRIMRFGGFMCLVYILETAERIRHLESESTHLMKWRDWILAEADRILGGKSASFVQLASWIREAKPSAPYIAQVQQLIEQAPGNEEAIHLSPSLPSWAQWSSTMRQQLIHVAEECIPAIPHSSSHLVLLQRVFHHCREIMDGVCDPLETMMEGNTLEAFYKLPMQHTNWSTFLSLLCHSKPQLRILEIGAGTGFATATALQHLKTPEGLKMYSTYTFTDISAGFMVRAKKEFEDEAAMEYNILDISRDPEEQGFSPGSFDLVIASNVLHSTPSLQGSLQNVRRLLAPQGRLLLNELHPELLCSDYIMGTLPGWWLGENDDRPNKPYVSPERWDQELRAAGFTGADAVAYDAPSPCQASATILSQVLPPEQPMVKEVAFLTKTRLAEPSGWAESVASQFESSGYSTEWATLDQPPLQNKRIISLLDMESPYLNDVTHEDYGMLQKYLIEARGCAFLWITKATQLACPDPRFGFIHGLASVLRHEMALDISILEIDTFDSAAASAVARVHEKILVNREEAPPRQAMEYEFAFANGAVHIGRFNWTSLTDQLAVQPTPESPRRLAIGSFGRLQSLQWVPIQPSEQLGKGDLEVDVRCVGLNFRDLMVSIGMVGRPEELGMEATGVVHRVGAEVTDFKPGDTVFLLGKGLLATRTVLHQCSCVKIPEGLSLEDAAAMPVAYLTAIHSLVKLGQIQKNQTVLIHSACGGVGISAINICQMLGAEIYATVGNEDKVRYLMENFGIPRDHIFHSRDSSFAADIMRATEGKGVDLVLNSLAGNLLHASWECVAKYGKMVELGKRDFITHGILDMRPFLENRTFYGVDIFAILDEDTDIGQEIRTIFHQWTRQGSIPPIKPITVFDAPRVVEAMQYLQSGKHMGKIIIRMSPLPDPSGLPCQAVTPSPVFSSGAAYLLVGGLGGIGQLVSTWMVEHGARELVYLSPSAGKLGQHQAFIRELEAQGCQVTCVTGTVTNLEDTRRAVSQCKKRLAGILHMPLSLKDRTFSHMSHDEWMAGIAPKVAGAWNLHQATEGLSLDFFVMFGSVVGLLQTGGQANYAAANTFLGSFAAFRREQGLAASVLNLGFVGDVGIVSRSSTYMNSAIYSGAPILGETEVLQSIQLAIRDSSLSSDSFCSAVGIGYNPTMAEGSPESPPWGADARFAPYANIPSSIVEVSGGKAQDELQMRLNQVAQNASMLDDPEMAAVIMNDLGRALWRLMAVDAEMSDEEVAGQVIDSLAAIEVRNWIRRVVKIELSTADMQKAKTVGGLTWVIVDHLRVMHKVTE